MSYSIKHLRYVVAVKQTGSLAKASEGMSVSVSSIREAIRLIEARLHISLFLSEPAKGMRLTRDGERFCALAEEFLSAYRGFEQAAAHIPHDWERDISLGVLASAGSLVMPTLVAQFSLSVLNGHIQLYEHSAKELSEAVRADKLAAAFTFNDDLHPSLAFVELFKPPLHIGLRPDHPLAGKNEIHLSELEEETYILLDFDGARRYYAGLFDHHGVKPRVGYTVSSREMAYSMVAAGLGYSVFNLCPLPTENSPMSEAIVRIPLISDYWSPAFGMIHLRGRSGGLIDGLHQVCRSIAGNIAQAGKDQSRTTSTR
ncbi:LysR family transcriptional regulator [Brenneria goodwinii]|uniref:Transcriptional regulator, LysR family n=1 Tax=Brenneria goodwinii TaxID=1109412 RepID=A0A0G4K2N3_9GAMM|nr:LysR family transcriptional regulator [Brenneria goodwinii]CPR21570.1 transcriptional regulator, LysR family [Brenneria goodwinii]